VSGCVPNDHSPHVHTQMNEMIISVVLLDYYLRFYDQRAVDELQIKRKLIVDEIFLIQRDRCKMDSKKTTSSDYDMFIESILTTKWK
jgi:hypothetical protein